MTIHSEPEKYALAVVGEVEFSSRCYEFDTTLVVRDVNTGAIYYADDSGCSCPLPFDGIGRDELTELSTMQQWHDYIAGRKADSYRYDPKWDPEAVTEIDNQVIAVTHKIIEARKAKP